MYTKVYSIRSDPEKRDQLLAHYDSVIIPAIRGSDHHVGHHMVEVSKGSFLLASSYRSAEAAEAAGPMVRELVAPMSDLFDMTLDVIGEGETIREVTKA